MGSDNGSEFINKYDNNILTKNNIIAVHGRPYCPHSQGIVERAHRTIRTALVSKYLENKEKFNLFLSLKEVVLTLNNITHVTTKKKPYEVFYSSNEKLFEVVKNNIINYSKNINKECSAIKEYDTILVFNNFISNYNHKKNLNYLERNRIKKRMFYLIFVRLLINVLITIIMK